MTSYELADLLAFVLVPVIGGVLLWLRQIDRKVIQHCTKLDNIEKVDTKTADDIEVISSQIVAIGTNITKICAQLEIQEVPIPRRTTKK